MAAISTIENESTIQELGRSAAPIGAAAPRKAPTRRSRRQQQWNHCMLWVRRIHLYSGLFMLPWVLLYGISGMLFNHPAAFSASRLHTIRAGHLEGTPLANIPTAGEVAAQVVAALNASHAETRDDGETSDVGDPQVAGSAPAAPRFRLVDPAGAQYTSGLSYNAASKDASYRVEFDLVTGGGAVYASTTETAPRPALASDPFSSRAAIKFDGSLTDQAMESIPAILSQLNIEVERATPGFRSPSVTFQAEADGKPWRVTYALADGRLSAFPYEERSSIDARSLLLRLHTAHGFPSYVNARWLWAIAVDAMFVSMVFWGMSGVFMWWQIKRTRFLGAGFLAASAVAATAMTVGMHDMLTTPGLRGGPPPMPVAPGMTSRSHGATKPADRSSTSSDAAPRKDQHDQASQDAPPSKPADASNQAGPNGPSAATGDE